MSSLGDKAKSAVDGLEAAVRVRDGQIDSLISRAKKAGDDTTLWQHRAEAERKARHAAEFDAHRTRESLGAFVAELQEQLYRQTPSFNVAGAYAPHFEQELRTDHIRIDLVPIRGAQHVSAFMLHEAYGKEPHFLRLIAEKSADEASKALVEIIYRGLMESIHPRRGFDFRGPHAF